MNDARDRQLARDLSVTAMRLNRRLRLRRARDRLPVAQLSILATIYREGPMTTGELALRERIKPPSVSRSSAALFESGLLQRVPHATDGRQVVLTLTETGRVLAEEDVAAREQELVEQLRTLTEAERETLAQATEILTGVVERAT